MKRITVFGILPLLSVKRSVDDHATIHIMRTILFYLTFIFLSCNQQDTIHNSETKSQSQNMDTRLVGVWNSDEKDDATKNSIGTVTMTFTNDGTLIYDIHEAGKLQRMNMVYKISGDTIISDQPSHPQEQHTRYKLENDNKLILEFEGQRTVFIKEQK